MNRRRGITLFEVKVAVALVAITLPMCGKVLWVLANAHRAESRAADERREFARLIWQLKTDALAAQYLVLGENVRLQKPDGSSIRYVSNPQGAERLAERGDETLHRDTFRLGTAQKLDFAADAATGRGIVSLVQPTRGGAKALPLRLPVRVLPGQGAP